MCVDLQILISVQEVLNIPLEMGLKQSSSPNKLKRLMNWEFNSDTDFQTLFCSKTVSVSDPKCVLWGFVGLFGFFFFNSLQSSIR